MPPNTFCRALALLIVALWLAPAGRPAAAQAAPAAAQPWVVVLCGASDIAFAPGRAAWYAGLMDRFEPYWSELSYGTLSTAGSQVRGPYALAQPSSAYWEQRPGGGYFMRQQQVFDDCLAAADADTFFPDFAGIHLVFPAPASYGMATAGEGGRATLTLDGQAREYGFTLIPLEKPSHQYVAHEWGHGLGLMHSGGPYASDYDSGWDVMSGARFGFPCTVAPDPEYGCLGQHTIAYHKQRLGWIQPEQVFTAVPGQAQTITLAPLDAPALAPGAYRYARIPVPLFQQPGSGLYTVEARRQSGYDQGVPGTAIVLHRVDEFASYSNRSAQVVDVDGNGDPNDEAAMWRPGETFVARPGEAFMDTVNNAFVVMCVVSESQGAFVVTIGLNASACGVTLAQAQLPLVVR